MHLRTTSRRAADGTTVRYLQLAHNVWDPATHRSNVRVLYHFGRADQLDHDATRRLIGSLSRALEPGGALALQAPELHFLESRPLGGSWALDQLWRRLGLDEIASGLLRERRLDPAAERVLFALVANRAPDPFSKLSCAAWVSEKVVIPGLPELDEDRCYRAVDWLLEIEAELAEQVYWSMANLLNLEVDLLFFDTTSTYFETDQADPPSEGAPKGFRTYNGHSKDHRPDLPQVVIGLAVTREGDPHPGVDLARQRRRPGAHPPGEGRPAGPGGWAAWCGWPTGASPLPRTGATCSAPAAITSWARSCGARVPRPKRPSPGRVTTGAWPTTSR